MQLAALYRYPLKGFTPERLDHADVVSGETLPWDRAFAIENGTRDVDPFEPKYFPKVKFLQLMQFERVASLTTAFDEATETMSFSKDGRTLVRGNPLTPVGRQLIEQFVAAYFKAELKGPPRLVHAPGHAFTDVPLKCVSLINLASVRDLERVIGRPVDPLRFRGNLLIEGAEPWAEREWTGRTLMVGQVELEVVEPIVRCAATNVDPATAECDMQIPRTLESVFGQNACGLYAVVRTGGRLERGADVTVS